MTIVASHDITSRYTPGSTTHHEAPRAARVRSLDVVRGAVMVLMALDHVRWFVSDARFDPTDLTKTTVALFLTRWVTHFCAPAFVFLAGTGAYLHGERLGGRAELSRFLATRGAWLVLIEMTVVRLGWTFNVDYAHYLFGGVIWMIGWCMIVMAALAWLPPAAVGCFGVAMIAGHNLLDGVLPDLAPAAQGGDWRRLWQILYLGGPVRLGDGGPVLAVLFVVVPWVGVMAAGYAFGPVMRMSPERRRRLCLWLGAGLVAAFVALRAANLYGDPRPWGPQRSPAFTALSFVNTTKYPASLLFLLMTLGPTVAILPLLERARGRAARALALFGRVPFLYYVLHLPLIHGVAVLLALTRYGTVIPWLTANQPMLAPEPPAGYGYGLAVVYAVTLIVVAILYVPCRWLAGVKERRRDRWLSFL
jgi:uncharacterized membrane protein